MKFVFKTLCESQRINFQIQVHQNQHVSALLSPTPTDHTSLNASLLPRLARLARLISSSLLAFRLRVASSFSRLCLFTRQLQKMKPLPDTIRNTPHPAIINAISWYSFSYNSLGLSSGLSVLFFGCGASTSEGAVKYEFWLVSWLGPSNTLPNAVATKVSFSAATQINTLIDMKSVASRDGISVSPHVFSRNVTYKKHDKWTDK